MAEWLKDSGWDEFFLDINPARRLVPGERWQEALKNAADHCTAIAAAFAEPGREPVIPREPAEQKRLLHGAFIPWLARIDPDTEERKHRLARWEEIPSESRPLIERLINRNRTPGGEV